jgi:hypothetical protein
LVLKPCFWQTTNKNNFLRQYLGTLIQEVLSRSLSIIGAVPKPGASLRRVLLGFLEKV